MYYDARAFYAPRALHLSRICLAFDLSSIGVACTLVFAQDAAADRKFRKLGGGRGLDANAVTAMLVDRDGMLRVASWEG
jgi:hypothetical protein